MYTTKQSGFSKLDLSGQPVSYRQKKALLSLVCNEDTTEHAQLHIKNTLKLNAIN